MPEPPTQPSSFLDELKRRKVVRIAIVYHFFAAIERAGNGDCRRYAFP